MTDEESVKPLRLVMRLRNNRLIKTRELLGYKTAADVARASGISHHVICAFESLRKSPWSIRANDWLEGAQALAAHYRVDCEYLWPEVVRLVQKTQAVMELDAGEAFGLLAGSTVPQLADETFVAKETLAVAMQPLTDVERTLVRAVYVDEYTLDEAATQAGLTVSTERVRQVVLRAAEKMRGAVVSHANAEKEADIDRRLLRRIVSGEPNECVELKRNVCLRPLTSRRGTELLRTFVCKYDLVHAVIVGTCSGGVECGLFVNDKDLGLVRHKSGRFHLRLERYIREPGTLKLVCRVPPSLDEGEIRILAVSAATTDSASLKLWRV